MKLAICLTAFASLACADDRTIHFIHPVTARGMQEIATLFRTVGQIRDVEPDPANASFLVKGSPAELDFIEWMGHQLDHPANWQPTGQEKTNPAAREYRLAPGERNGIARSFHLESTLKPQTVQELLTILRTVLDVQMIFNYTDRQMLVYRGTPVQLDAVDWTLKILDSPADTPVPQEPMKLDARFFDLLRIYRLPPNTSTQQMQELIATLRTKDNVMKVFNLTSPPMLVEAGTAAMLDQTARRIDALRQ
jgi:hypothetical protein